MKRLLLLVFTLAGTAAVAQEFKPVKVNLSMGYAPPIGARSTGGILMSIEPKYGLNDRVDIGLRYELGLLVRTYTLDNQRGDTELRGASSYLITGSYLLSDSDFRPFAGAGVGLYSILNVNFSGSSGSTTGGISGGNKLGVMLRTGIKARHFVLAAEYNLVPKTRGIAVSNTGANLNYESSNAYLGIKLGLDIGGGRF